MADFAYFENCWRDSSDSCVTMDIDGLLLPLKKITKNCFFNEIHNLFIISAYQGRMKRRGHATTINPITNGRGFMSNNSKECVARALYTLYSLVGGG